MLRKYLIILVSVSFGARLLQAAVPAQIVTEVPNARCEERTFGTEVRFFKISRISSDLIDEKYEDLMATTLQGTVNVMIAGPARPVGRLGMLVRQHDESSPRYRSTASAWHGNYAMAIPVVICPPSNGYDWHLGQVLVSEWENAERVAHLRDNQGMPPSTKANPIPQRIEAKGETTTPLF